MNIDLEFKITLGVLPELKLQRTVYVKHRVARRIEQCSFQD